MIEICVCIVCFQIEESLVKHGGEKIEYFSDYVKICIVGEDPLETDLTDAKEIYEVPAVRQDWVTFSLSCKKQLEYPLFLSHGRYLLPLWESYFFIFFWKSYFV